MQQLFEEHNSIHSAVLSVELLTANDQFLKKKSVSASTTFKRLETSNNERKNNNSGSSCNSSKFGSTASLGDNGDSDPYGMEIACFPPLPPGFIGRSSVGLFNGDQFVQPLTQIEEQQYFSWDYGFNEDSGNEFSNSSDEENYPHCSDSSPCFRAHCKYCNYLPESKRKRTSDADEPYVSNSLKKLRTINYQNDKAAQTVKLPDVSIDNSIINNTKVMPPPKKKRRLQRGHKLCPSCDTEVKVRVSTCHSCGYIFYHTKNN